MESHDKTIIEHPEATKTRLVELERARQELTSMIAHDMLNLLHEIVGFFDLVDQGLLTPQAPEFAEFMAMASQSSRELMLMINSVLDVYKLEDGRLALNRRPANLAELAAHSTAQMRPFATQNDVHLAFDIPPDLPPPDVDGELIVCVLSNLLLSAIKATPAGGQVRVTATTQQGPPVMVQVSVSDTGESIAAERLERIFDRFYQPARRRRSTDLGLTFCKKAVELHGGRIWAESESGRGNIFHFTLPVAAEAIES
jgi:NtrC-family two-component system sensor histidine kinase KinB